MDPKARFSNRVDDYIRYRPGYPGEVLAVLHEKCRLSRSSVVADIGFGTGILTEMLLAHGCEVYGVEPNREMREAGQRILEGFTAFHCVDGAAEATTLESSSVDLVTAAQAFHWFNREKTRPELVRILKPGGSVALIWNERKLDASPFLEAYEKLLRTFGTDYDKVTASECTPEVVGAFFAPSRFTLTVLQNRQDFDLTSLRGRLLSSSYAPAAGHPNHEPMLEELARIFAEHAKDGQVSFEYDTKVYTGRL